MGTSRGFTLVELVVVLALAAIIVGLAVPAFTGMIQNNRAASEANQFIAALNLARSEAVTRNQSVFVTASTPGTWADGWRVWADVDNDNAFDAGEEIREFAGLSGGSTLTSVEAIDEFEYLGTGTLNIAAGATRTFQLRIPKCTGDQGRDITLNALGRPSVVRVTCS